MDMKQVYMQEQNPCIESRLEKCVESQSLLVSCNSSSKLLGRFQRQQWLSLKGCYY